MDAARNRLNRAEQAQSSDHVPPLRTQIQGVVRRIWHRAATGGWTVMALQADGTKDLVRAVGTMHVCPVVGQRLRAQGYWKQSAKWGREFIVEKLVDPLPETAAGFEALLASGAFRGIGRVLARRLAERIGVALPAVVMNHPERLLDVPGIGEKHIEVLRRGLGMDAGAVVGTGPLRRLGLSKVEAIRIVRAAGSADVVQQLCGNPYLALSWGRVSWGRVDALARQRGVAAQDARRLTAAVIWVLEQHAEQGGVWCHAAEVLREVHGLINVPIAVLEEHLQRADRCPGVTRHAQAPNWLGSTRWVSAEREIESVMEPWLARAGKPLERTLPGEPSWPSALQRVWGSAGLWPLVSLTGWCGATMVEWWRRLNDWSRSQQGRIVGVTRTEREAQRWRERTEGVWVSASDPELHQRLTGVPWVIGIDPGTWDFVTWRRILRALSRVERWWLWGDPEHQVWMGPGQVFRDLGVTGVAPSVSVPVAGEDRQSLRAEWTLAIRRREVPAIRETQGADLTWIDAGEIGEIRRQLESWFERHREWTAQSCVVLSSVAKTPLGTEALNTWLQGRWNAGGRHLPETELRVGDPVVVRSIQSDAAPWGEHGVIVDYEAMSGQATIQLGSRAWTVPFWDWDSLMLAYALDVRWAVTRTWPYAVIVVGPTTTQRWLAAALTRATGAVVVIGTLRTLSRAVRRTGSVPWATGLFRTQPQRLVESEEIEENEGLSRRY